MKEKGKVSSSEDKYVGTVKVGSRGQIVIPKDMRTLLDVDSGERLLMLADKKNAIALQKFDPYLKKINELFYHKEDK